MSDRECEPICYTKPTENSIIGSFLSERTLAAKQLCSFLDPDVSLAPLCRKKGEAKRTHEVACQLWRRDAVATPTLHSIVSPPRVRFWLAECVSFSNRKVILFEVWRLWPTWKKTTRGFALPTLERKVGDVSAVSVLLIAFVLCGI